MIQSRSYLFSSNMGSSRRWRRLSLCAELLSQDVGNSPLNWKQTRAGMGAEPAGRSSLVFPHDQSGAQQRYERAYILFVEQDNADGAMINLCTIWGRLHGSRVALTMRYRSIAVASTLPPRSTIDIWLHAVWQDWAAQRSNVQTSNRRRSLSAPPIDSLIRCLHSLPPTIWPNWSITLLACTPISTCPLSLQPGIWAKSRRPSRWCSPH